MELREYCALDATDLARIIAEREVEVAQVKACAYKAIAATNETLNAVIETWEADEPCEKMGDWGLLRGVPYLVKDLPFEKGRTCEMGSQLGKGVVCQEDSAVVDRLRTAGALSVGRTTTSEFALAAVTENRVTGQTANPWAPDRSAAGSSGGSASAVAAGMVPFALGNDGGGSIRMPASFCGLVGLKPSRGRVTCAPDPTLNYSGLVVPFALTRSVRDAALLLDCTQGAAVGDDVVIVQPKGSYVASIKEATPPLRIGVATEPWSGVKVDGDVKEAVSRVAEQCAELGHEVQISRPQFDFDRYLEAQKAIWSAYAHADIAALGRETGREPSESNLQSSTLAVYERGRAMLSEDLINALQTYHAVTRDVAKWFETFDVLLTPTCAITPRPLGAYDPDAKNLSVDSFFEEQLAPHESFTSLANCTGQPAISLPIRQSRDGLPIGIQIMTRFGDEKTLLQMGAQLEQVNPQGRESLPLIHSGRT